MLRTAIPRTLFRPLTTAPLKAARAQPHFQSRVSECIQFTSRLCTLSSKRPRAIATSTYKLNLRSSSKYDKPDTKLEEKVRKEKIEAHPELVSTTSSTHALFSELGTKDPEKDTDMTAGIAADLKTIKDTFDLSDVPKKAYWLGLAGVLPYLATSVATIGVAQEMNVAHEQGMGYIMTAEQAEHLLHILEPLQVGYGAVIISFLGAIHWGLEWANYGGKNAGMRRYMIGVLAPAVAWPTTLMPVEYALITQFLAFTSLYYADSRASRRGLAPPWYGTYRFVLTFIVGASIVVSLIGRGQIHGEMQQKPMGPAERIQKLTDGMGKQLEEEEEAHRAAIVAQEEKDAAEESSAGEEDAEGEDESEGEDDEKKGEKKE
ncbi:hypothetical protein FKW77_001576 [Venturia effusa]|uniref:Mitochondrial inner membrane protein 1 n=1 Tax=Venturia effusa TaxID=50376 RepID=A0A517LGK3_9PEZI|nr:hypothetical protein FKW77_001576 [Venturia effusa]